MKQKAKTRPIDDYKSPFVNCSVAQSETASVHTVDHIAAMVACVMRTAQEKGIEVELNAKAWDLADAYKQVPLSEKAFELDSFLVVYSPTEKGPEVYKQRVLPFGSVASVTAFLRISLALWKIETKLLGLVWSSYFDDYFSVTEAAASSRHTDLVISSLFSILGWRLSADKLVAYDTVCKVLGVKFDLRQSGAVLAFVLNTDERVQEFSDNLEEIIQTRRLKRSEGEKLRGRLLFASGQLFGRYVRNQVRLLSQHIRSGRVNLVDETLEALSGIKSYLQANVPRKIMGSLSEHIHIYVDASFEEDSYSGLGGAVFDCHGKALAFFSEEVKSELVQAIRSEGQVTLIQELEMLALLVALTMWCPLFESHRVVAFTDSESVGGSFLKTWSNNVSNSHMLAQVFRVEERCLCQVWIERVPGQSNPVDILSREKVERWKGLDRQCIDCHSVWLESAQNRGKSATDTSTITPASKCAHQLLRAVDQGLQVRGELICNGPHET